MPDISSGGSGGSGGKKKMCCVSDKAMQKTCTKRRIVRKKKNFVNAAASVQWSSEWDTSRLEGSQPSPDTSCLIFSSNTDFAKQGRGWGGGRGVMLGLDVQHLCGKKQLSSVSMLVLLGDIVHQASSRAGRCLTNCPLKYKIVPYLTMK